MSGPAPPPPAESLRYDRALAARLARERAERGNDRLFYQRAAWARLRARVIAEWRGACADCLAASPARYSPATCVHHDRFVDRWPGWALSEWWLDESGPAPVVRRNLWPLCDSCHNARHGRFEHGHGSAPAAPPLTDERW